MWKFLDPTLTIQTEILHAIKAFKILCYIQKRNANIARACFPLSYYGRSYTHL